MKANWYKKMKDGNVVFDATHDNIRLKGVLKKDRNGEWMATSVKAFLLGGKLTELQTALKVLEKELKSN